MPERLEGGQLQCLCCHRTTDMSLRFYKKKTANIMFECSCNAQPGIREAVEALYHTLQIRHIDVLRMVFERFKSTLLGMQHTTEQQQRLFRLLRPSMQLSNEDLGCVLQMRDVLQGRNLFAPLQNDNAHRFHIRSWIFKPWQLLRVVRALRQEGFCFPELDK